MMYGTNPDTSRSRLGPKLVGSGAARLLTYGGAWAVLTEGEAASWIVGGPLVLAATAAGVLAVGGDDPRLRLHRVPLFVLQFIHESIRGGIDVAYRAFHPGLPLSPGVVTTSFGGDHDAERALTACIANLLPGTLTAEESRDRMIIHVLHTGVSGTEDIAVLRKRVAGLFKAAP